MKAESSFLSLTESRLPSPGYTKVEGSQGKVVGLKVWRGSDGCRGEK